MNPDYLPVEEIIDDEFYPAELHKSRLRKKNTCVHAYWVCKCSICGEILGSETKPDIILDILKRSHHDFNPTKE